jgi:hypothetical protein
VERDRDEEVGCMAVAVMAAARSTLAIHITRALG